VDVAFLDVETHPIAIGRQAPPVVCGAWMLQDIPAMLLDQAEHLRMLHYTLDRGAHVCGHHIAFDLAASCATDETLSPKVFAAYAAGRVHCTMLRQKLIDIARGIYRAGKKPKFDEQGRAITYSLIGVAKRYWDCARPEKEEGQATRYGALADTPIKQWSTRDRQYPLDDVRDCARIFQEQAPWGATGWLENEADRTRAAWFQQLISVWGMNTNPVKVAALERMTRDEFHRLEITAIDDGCPT